MELKKLASFSHCFAKQLKTILFETKKSWNLQEKVS